MHCNNYINHILLVFYGNYLFDFSPRIRRKCQVCLGERTKQMFIISFMRAMWHRAQLIIKFNKCKKSICTCLTLKGANCQKVRYEYFSKALDFPKKVQRNSFKSKSDDNFPSFATLCFKGKLRERALNKQIFVDLLTDVQALKSPMYRTTQSSIISAITFL